MWLAMRFQCSLLPSCCSPSQRPGIRSALGRFRRCFNQFAVPNAILRFKQGFGRLIRSRTDRGVVAILDRRVISKRYGQAFLDFLPECTIKHGPTANLPLDVRHGFQRLG